MAQGVFVDAEKLAAGRPVHDDRGVGRDSDPPAVVGVTDREMGVMSAVGVMHAMMTVVAPGLGGSGESRAGEGDGEGGKKHSGGEADARMTLEHTMIRWPFPGRKTRRRDVNLTKL